MGAKKASFDADGYARNAAEEIYFKLSGMQQLKMRAFYEGVLLTSLPREIDVINALSRTLLGDLGEANSDLNSLGMETLLGRTQVHGTSLADMFVDDTLDVPASWDTKTRFQRIKVSSYRSRNGTAKFDEPGDYLRAKRTSTQMQVLPIHVMEDVVELPDLIRREDHDRFMQPPNSFRADAYRRGTLTGTPLQHLVKY